MKAITSATAQTPSRTPPSGSDRLGIPDQKAEIVEGLPIVLAADHAGNDPVEIDLATKDDLGDLLTSDGDERRPERDKQHENEKDDEDLRVRIGSRVLGETARGDQLKRLARVEPSVVERTADDRALQHSVARLDEPLHVVD